MAIRALATKFLAQAVTGGGNQREKALAGAKATVASARIEFEGMDEILATIRSVQGREGQKALGQVHKDIGERIIIPAVGGKQTGVGTGGGSAIRPSANARSILLRVGGAHRDDERQQWGKQQVWPPPERPHIIGTAVEQQDRIEQAYLDGVERVLKRGAFQ